MVHFSIPADTYLIGFIDDYSRYITSLGLYRSETFAQLRFGLQHFQSL